MFYFGGDIKQIKVVALCLSDLSHNRMVINFTEITFGGDLVVTLRNISYLCIGV